MNMKHLTTSLRAMVVFTLLTGLAYPLLVTGVAQVVFPHQAAGSFVKKGKKVTGSVLVGQEFTGPKHFWGRPSAIAHNPQPSGGSNLGPASKALTETVQQRAADLRQAHGLGAKARVPVDLIFASASGVDPHISPSAARFQVNRVAQAWGLDSAGKKKLNKLVNESVQGPELGLFGDPRVNVLMLNLAVEEAFR